MEQSRAVDRLDRVGDRARAAGPHHAGHTGRPAGRSSVPPGTSSRTRYSHPSASPTSYSRTTFCAAAARRTAPRGAIARGRGSRHRARSARPSAPPGGRGWAAAPGRRRPCCPGRARTRSRSPGIFGAMSRSGSDAGASHSRPRRSAPTDSAQPGSGTTLDVALERGERLFPERIGPEPGQRGGGRTGIMDDPPNIGVNGDQVETFDLRRSGGKPRCQGGSSGRPTATDGLGPASGPAPGSNRAASRRSPSARSIRSTRL